MISCVCTDLNLPFATVKESHQLFVSSFFSITSVMRLVMVFERGCPPKALLWCGKLNSSPNQPPFNQQYWCGVVIGGSNLVATRLVNSANGKQAALTFNFFLVSHAHHAQSCTLPWKHKKLHKVMLYKQNCHVPRYSKSRTS